LTISSVLSSDVPGEKEKFASKISLSGVSKNSKFTLPVDNNVRETNNIQIVAVIVKPFFV